MDVILQKKKTITVALLSLGNGEHYHIAGTSEQSVHSHFETDEAEEPAHEGQVALTCGDGELRARASQKKGDNGAVKQF